MSATERVRQSGVRRDSVFMTPEMMQKQGSRRTSMHPSIARILEEHYMSKPEMQDRVELTVAEEIAPSEPTVKSPRDDLTPSGSPILSPRNRTARSMSLPTNVYPYQMEHAPNAPQA